MIQCMGMSMLSRYVVHVHASVLRQRNVVG